MSDKRCFVWQMGREKALIDFDEEAMQEDYVPYTIENPEDSSIYSASPPIVDINYAFSFVTYHGWPPSYLQWGTYETYEEIYNNFLPTMDITNMLDIEVVE